MPEELVPNINKLNQSICNKTEEKIALIYEGTGKKFILHLIRAFIPVDKNSKMRGFKGENELVCCLTNQKLTGIMDMDNREGKLELMMLRCKIDTAENQKKRENYIKDYNRLVEIMPKEIRRKNVAYCSDTSDKCLSEDALVALNRFAFSKLQEGDNDIKFILGKRVRKSNKKGSKKSKKGLFDTVTFGDISVLQEVRSKFMK